MGALSAAATVGGAWARHAKATGPEAPSAIATVAPDGRGVEVDRLAVLADLIKKAEGRKRNAALNSLEAASDEMRGEFLRLADEAAAQIAAWVEEQARLEEVLACRDTMEAQVEALVDLGDRARAKLQTATYKEKRAVLHAFGVEVRVWRLDHEPQYTISWKFDQTFEAWAQQALTGTTSGSFGLHISGGRRRARLKIPTRRIQRLS